MRMRDYSTVKKARSSAAKSEDNSETKYPLARSDQEERVCITPTLSLTPAHCYIEYIGQLEGEVAAKTNEAAELKRMNHALMQENARFKVLAEKLLAHSAFHPFLEELSRDPALAETLSSVSASSVALQQSRSQMTKDMDPFAGSQQYAPPSSNETTVGMTLIPEMPVDLSALNLGSQNNWGIPSSRSHMGQFVQPQVFAVTEVPEGPAEPLDFSALSGKGSDDILSHFTEDEKTTYPEIEMPAKSEAVIEERATKEEAAEEENEIDENDETMILFASSSSSNKKSEPIEVSDNLFGDIASEKVFAHFELFISSEQDNQNLMDRFEHLCSRLESRSNRIEALMSGL